MWEVFKGEVPVHLRSNVNVGFIPEKTSKLKILNAIDEALKPKSMKLDWQHMPDSIWLINTLFTLKPEHEFFRVTKAKTEDD